MVGTATAYRGWTTRTIQVLVDSEGCARLTTPEELDIQISLRQSADDQDINITQRSCTKSHRKLAVHENSAGSYKTEYTSCQQRLEDGATVLKAQSISRFEARTAYRSIYHPGMRYSLPATSSDRQELVVVFGCSVSGGIGVRHLYIEQVSIKISALLEHIRQNGRLGQMIWIPIQCAQVKVSWCGER